MDARPRREAEPSWHRRARRQRQTDRLALQLAAAYARMIEHHGYSMPRILQGFQLTEKRFATMAPDAHTHAKSHLSFTAVARASTPLNADARPFCFPGHAPSQLVYNETTRRCERAGKTPVTPCVSVTSGSEPDQMDDHEGGSDSDKLHKSRNASEDGFSDCTDQEFPFQDAAQTVPPSVTSCPLHVDAANLVSGQAHAVPSETAILPRPSSRHLKPRTHAQAASCTLSDDERACNFPSSSSVLATGASEFEMESERNSSASALRLEMNTERSPPSHVHVSTGTLV